MPKPLLFLLVSLVATVLSSPAAVAQEYYKWVDDEGVTHYSSEKPEGKDASTVRAHNPASSSQDEALKRLEQQRQETAQQREAARKKEEEEQEREDNPQKALKEDCKKHRENLKILTNKPTVRRKNPETGQMEVLTEEKKQQMIEKTKKQLEQCNQLGVESGESE
jgi:hypothetical protein